MKALLLTFNLFCGLDSATTVYGIRSGQFHEAVWPVQNPDALIAMNAGQCVAVSYAGAKLPRKVGIPVLIVSTAARAWAVQHNIRVMR